ncbi:helix-turn-helix domain-containing protein [Streptomyces sp. WAC04114]|uniref:helix-turn-helix domain-containing protein n=1 Tax=Streptomyces sp. WAC04114 TaxID=2867961 RepID=UPI001C8BF86E|nr:helix-turn-helix domain-containing protein [Streptomyces sp. WAC04114]MBX9366832.1 helix-turn-helix domain-containing protein [Streptomyces sp. WAC04114]
MTQSPALPLPPPKERRRLREAASLTRAQLASRVGVTGETVRGWETGRVTPRGRKGEKYAKLLNSLGDESEVTPPQDDALDDAVDDDALDDDTPEPAPPAAVSRRTARARRKTAADDRKRPSAAKDRGRGPATVPDHGHSPATHHNRSAVPHAHHVILTERRRTTPVRRPDDAITALTPDQAFDALYAFCAPALVRQTYLLTGRRELARESVERAFQIAWQRWPEVARDRDPAGWVRAMAYECALSPWHRLRLRHRHPEPPPPDAFDRALMDTLLKLPPSYRRTLVLYDGVGLGLPETAAETEASTRAAVNRLAHAREALAERLPELADPETLHWRLVELASTERLRAAKPPVVRKGGERRARFWTRAAIAFTVALIGTTALTVRTAPTHYEPSVPPGETVQGVPPPVAPGPLSESEQELRAKLRKEEQKGPDRLRPQPR